jgi:hypothetical protein
MPVLSLSELNIVLGVLGTFPRSYLTPSHYLLGMRPWLTCFYLGTFILFYAIISVKIKQAWYLGEAC